MRRLSAIAPMFLVLVACKNEKDGCPDEEAAIDRELALSPCDLATGGLATKVDNPYFPLPAGRVWTYHGEDEGTPLDLVITVLPDKEMVGNVETLVVEERESEDNEVVEVSRNYFAQASDGTVCYLGEEVDTYDGAEVTGHGGSWRADDPDTRAGIQMPAMPNVGDGFYQEKSPGVAEDRSRITAVGETVMVPAGMYTNAIRTHDWSPIEPCEVDTKAYGMGVGLLVDEELQLVSISG